MAVGRRQRAARAEGGWWRVEAGAEGPTAEAASRGAAGACGVIILGRVDPHAGLAQPVALARRTAVLEGRVDRIRLPPARGAAGGCGGCAGGAAAPHRARPRPAKGCEKESRWGGGRVSRAPHALRKLADKVVVPAAEEAERQHAAHHLLLVRPEEARVREALDVVGLPLEARQPVELALVPPRLRLLADDAPPFLDQGQRRRAEEHVADVEGRVDAAVVLEPLVVGRVRQVVRRREEARVGPSRHERERIAQHQLSRCEARARESQVERDAASAGLEPPGRGMPHRCR